MSKMAREIHGIRVGRAQVRTTAPAHVKGVPSGNGRNGIVREGGFVAMPFGARGTARRSTGINPQAREPIDPRMPCFSPP